MDATCSRLRALVQDCLDKHLATSAVFYADKLVTLSGSAPSDVFLLAQVKNGVCPLRTPRSPLRWAMCAYMHASRPMRLMAGPFGRLYPRACAQSRGLSAAFAPLQAYFASRQYRRAVALLRSAGVLEEGAEFLQLAACCLVETGEWEEVVSLLGDDEAGPGPQALEV